ncbi:MAG: tetratricopeptide repeat protein, partial [Bacteroidia bacterium]
MKNIKKYYFLLIPFFFLFQPGMAALSATDSLEKKLETAVGEPRVELLNELSFNISNKDPERSFLLAKEALELSIKLNYDKGKASALNNFGLCYYDKSKYDSALYYYIQSLKLEEKLGNKKRIAVVNGNIGLLYSEQMNYPKALEYLEKACESQKDLGNKDKEAACQNNIGVVYYKLQVYYKALEKFKAAAALYKELNDKENMSSCLSNIGAISQDLKDYKTALDYYLMALKTYQEYDNKEGIATSYQNIGSIYDLLGEHDKAIEYLQKGMDLAKQINAKDLIDYAYQGFGEAYKNKKNIDSTYKYLLLYANYKDTIFNMENSKNVADMQTKYETEKKEAEIKLLNKDKERQKIVLYAVVFGLLLVIALAFFIFRGYKQKQRANSQLKEKNSLIEEKNKIVEEKNKDITDSIRYAKRLQTAILKPADTLTNYFEDGFILFKPKDIVSGDFYWFEKFGNLSMVAAAD